MLYFPASWRTFRWTRFCHMVIWIWSMELLIIIIVLCQWRLISTIKKNARQTEFPYRRWHGRDREYTSFHPRSSVGTNDRRPAPLSSLDRSMEFIFVWHWFRTGIQSVRTHARPLHTRIINVSLFHSIVHHVWAALSIVFTARMHFNFIFSSFAATFDETKYANTFHLVSKVVSVAMGIAFRSHLSFRRLLQNKPRWTTKTRFRLKGKVSHVVIAYVNPCTMWFTKKKYRVASTGWCPSVVAAATADGISETARVVS